jgi:hypothetical protein
MNQPHSHRHLLTAGCIALGSMLSACGGGSDPVIPASTGAAADRSTSAAIDRDAVSTQASQAARIPTLTAQAVDLAMRSAQAAATGHTTAAAAEGRMRTLASSHGEAAALATAVPIACPGGGSASVVVTGTDLAGVLNGVPDAGEQQVLDFTACQWAAGLPALDGQMSLVILAADASGWSADLSLTQLSTRIGSEQIGLQGQLRVDLSGNTSAEGSPQALRLRSDSLMLSLAGNQPLSVELTQADLTFKTSLAGTAMHLDALSGQHSQRLQWTGGGASYRVATLGEVRFGANGMPTSGGWALSVAQTRIELEVQTGTAVIRVDLGDDGSTELSFSLPLSWIFPATA